MSNREQFCNFINLNSVSCSYDQFNSILCCLGRNKATLAQCSVAAHFAPPGPGQARTCGGRSYFCRRRSGKPAAPSSSGATQRCGAGRQRLCCRLERWGGISSYPPSAQCSAGRVRPKFNADLCGEDLNPRNPSEWVRRRKPAPAERLLLRPGNYTKHPSETGEVERQRSCM